jgi:type 1 glutamine amidotransferase/HEAT repeat protein
MKRSIPSVLFALIAAGLHLSSARPLAAETARPKKIKVVLVAEGDEAQYLGVLMGHRDLSAVVEKVNPVIKKEGKVFEDVEKWPYDVIVLYTLERDLSEQQRANFLKLMDKGVGLVVAHHSLAAFQKWPEFKQIAGGKFYLEKAMEDGREKAPSAANHDQDYTIHVADAEHPIVKDLPDFKVKDELFKGIVCLPDSHVILTVDHANGDKPIGWVRTYRNSRVCFIGPGHGPAILSMPEYRHLVAQAIRWTANRPMLAFGASQVLPLELAFEDILSYEYGQTRQAAIVLEKRVNETAGDPDARKELIQRFVSLLENPQATLACREFVCMQLMRIGGAEAVPALAKMIGEDEKPAVLARFALERIPDAAAGAALCDALSRTQGAVRIGVINSLGERRQPDAVSELSRLVTDKDEATAAAAAAALGKIGGPDAAKLLMQAKTGAPAGVRRRVVEGLLCAADQLAGQGKTQGAADIYQSLYTETQSTAVRIAALRGLVATGGDSVIPLLRRAGDDKDAQLSAYAKSLLNRKAE